MLDSSLLVRSVRFISLFSGDFLTLDFLISLSYLNCAHSEISLFAKLKLIMSENSK